MTNSRDPWDPPGPDKPAWGACGLYSLPRQTMHRLAHPDWRGPSLRIAVVSDPHVCRPWLTPQTMTEIIVQVNALDADLILLTGDFLPDRNLPCRHLKADEIVPLFDALSAPLGVIGVPGNHDYADCALSRATDFQENSVIDAFSTSKHALLRNESRRLTHDGSEFWVVGLDSQVGRGRKVKGFENPDLAFAEVPEGAPSILLAHEPDYFAEGDRRPMLQISGHTHGGQFTLFGRRPMTPSEYGDRYAIGHIREEERHLIVSAGLGYSGLPFRFGVPPELTLIEITGTSEKR